MFNMHREFWLLGACLTDHGLLGLPAELIALFQGVVLALPILPDGFVKAVVFSCGGTRSFPHYISRARGPESTYC